MDRSEGERILSGLISSKRDIRRAMERIEACKQNRTLDENPDDIFIAYEEALKKRNAFDLNDLIHLPVRLLRENSFIRLNYSDRYRHVLVDEFQDINLRQYELMNLLVSGPDANIFIIGDPDQAIYGFRGSDPRFMDEFALRYPSQKESCLKKATAVGTGYRRRIPGPAEGQGNERLMSELKIQIRPFESERSRGGLDRRHY